MVITKIIISEIPFKNYRTLCLSFIWFTWHEFVLSFHCGNGVNLKCENNVNNSICRMSWCMWNSTKKYQYLYLKKKKLSKTTHITVLPWIKLTELPKATLKTCLWYTYSQFQTLHLHRLRQSIYENGITFIQKGNACSMFKFTLFA